MLFRGAIKDYHNIEEVEGSKTTLYAPYMYYLSFKQLLKNECQSIPYFINLIFLLNEQIIIIKEHLY